MGRRSGKGWAWLQAQHRPRTLRPLNQPHHLPLIGKSVSGLLRIDQLAVNHDFKNTVGALNQAGIHRQGILQLRGQTGRVGKIVSHSAIFDFYLHPSSEKSENCAIFDLKGVEGLPRQTSGLFYV